MNTRVALYLRVSTADQNSDMQLRELRDYCQRKGWEIAEEFIDHGISGAKKSRPALDKLMMEARAKAFDAVVVYRYDRFARSLSHLVNALEEFDGLGVNFISIHEGVDTSTPSGRLVFGIFASIAEFERKLIGERVRSGARAAKARGSKLGRRRIAGLNRNDIDALRNQGLSWRGIASQLGQSEATVRRHAAYS